MLAVQQQKRLCCQLVDVSAARRVHLYPVLVVSVLLYSGVNARCEIM